MEAFLMNARTSLVLATLAMSPCLAACAATADRSSSTAGETGGGGTGGDGAGGHDAGVHDGGAPPTTICGLDCSGMMTCTDAVFHIPATGPAMVVSQVDGGPPDGCSARLSAPSIPGSASVVITAYCSGVGEYDDANGDRCGGYTWTGNSTSFALSQGGEVGFTCTLAPAK